MLSRWLLVLPGILLACSEVRRPIGELRSDEGGANDLGPASRGALGISPPTPDQIRAAASNGRGGDGQGGSDATAVTPLQPAPSTGCGSPLPAEQVPTVTGSFTGYTDFSVNLTGATLSDDQPELAGPRHFAVRVPADYDQNQPYRIVYVHNECDKDINEHSSYALFDEERGGTEEAIYVTPGDLAEPPASWCLDVDSGVLSREWQAFQLIHGFIESHYCVDNSRIYVVGDHPGADLANMWGCYFGGAARPPLDAPDLALGLDERKFSPSWQIRGIATVAGGDLLSNQPLPCNGPIAKLVIHDTLDQPTRLPAEVINFNQALQTNGCSGDYEQGPKQPWAPAARIEGLSGDVCQEYTGCPADVVQHQPLIFCTTSGFGHVDQSARAIPAFRQFFERVERGSD